MEKADKENIIENGRTLRTSFMNVIKKRKNKNILARPKNQNPERELKIKRNVWHIIQNLRLISH
jgi:hypothetical protein